MDHIGTKIRIYREEAGVSQKRLGIALGLSDKAISSYESNRTLPPLETLYKIAKYLNKPVASFLSDEDYVRIDDRLTSIEKSMERITRQIRRLRKDMIPPL